MTEIDYAREALREIDVRLERAQALKNAAEAEVYRLRSERNALRELIADSLKDKCNLWYVPHRAHGECTGVQGRSDWQSDH